MTQTTFRTRSIGLWGLLCSLCLIGCFTAIFGVNRAFAQDFRASISGAVYDSSGAALPGASITAINADTGVRYSTKTDSQGAYSLLYITPGAYKVTVEAPAFQTMVYNNVRLDTAQKLGMDATLKPGSVAEQVVVKVEDVELDTVSATSGGVIDQQRVENMPSMGMMAWDDLAFTQGMRSTAAQPFNITPRNDTNTYSAAGAQTDENVYYINGAAANNSSNNWTFVPSTEATSQLQAAVMPYDAQYGRTGGGAFSITTKNGTNQFHGAVYDFYGNQVLNSNTWQADLTGTRKPINIRNTYGGAIGGPIRKGKTFFFGSFEGFRQDQPGLTLDSVPPTAWRSGNFQGSGYTIYDPLSTTCTAHNTSGACTAYSRTAFPSDQIPSNRISPIGQALIALYPTPTNSTAATSNYATIQSTTYGYDQYLGRVDHNFSENTRIYGLFAYQKDSMTQGGNGFNSVGTTKSNQYIPNYTTILDLTRILSATKVLDLKASWGHYAPLSHNGVTLQQNVLASEFGFNMPAVYTTSQQNIVPTIGIASYTGLFGNTASGTEWQDADFSGSMTQLVHQHSLHYGFEFMGIQYAPTGMLGNPHGAFSFGSGSTSFTQQNPNSAATGSGNAIADLLLGFPYSGSVSWNEPYFLTMHYYGTFLQDDWKVLPKLSLNLGLRWDVSTSPRDRLNRINAGFNLTSTNPISQSMSASALASLTNPVVGGLQFAGVNGISSTPFNVQMNNWQPRVGFSWNALRDTVIRGGYGIYDPFATVNYDDTGFSQTTSYVNSPDSGLTPSTTFNAWNGASFGTGNPYPNGATAPTGSSLGLETNLGNSISFNDLNRRLRMTQHWSLGVQRAMPASVLLDVEYMGTTVHSIPMSTSLSAVTTAQQQACYTSQTCTNTVTNPFYGVLPSTSTLGASAKIANWELTRPFPQFNGVTMTNAPMGSSHYNALDVRVERRVQSLNFVFNYMYSNWIDRDSWLNTGNFQDAKPTKALDGNDRRNYIDSNIVYPLPSTHEKGIVGALANHWLVDTSIIWGTGGPLSLPSANFNWGTAGCTSYAPTGGQTRAHWFNNNESCWHSLASFEARTTPSNIGFIRGPATIINNAAFQKRFALPREGMFVQYRMEAWNAINHPTWGGANTSLSPAASYTSTSSWTGFGTLPNSQANIPRNILASLKIIF